MINSTSTFTTLDSTGGTQPSISRFERGECSSTDLFIDRLRIVREKIARWMPCADTLATWRITDHHVYSAAARLQDAVQELDTTMSDCASAQLDPADASLTLQMLLCNVESRAAEFEDVVIHSYAGAN